MKNRQTAIDYMKGTLVIGMVLAHSLQLLSKPKGIFAYFSTTINLITFSGFFLCFGYVFYLAYLSKPFGQVSGKMAKTAGKSLLAYYLSGFSSFLMLYPRFMRKPYPLSFEELSQLVTFTKAAWVSEFLLTFFLLTLLVLVFFKGFQYLANSPRAMLGVGVACLLTAIFLPPDLVVIRPLALLVGTQGEYFFPIVQYLPIFLVGLYFAHYKIVWHPLILVLSGLGTVLLIGYYVQNRVMPPEFIPSIFWLVGSYGILYGYFLAAKWLERQAYSIEWLLSVGRNTLFYLLVSNFILFALGTHIQTDSWVAFLIGMTILLSIGFLISLLTPAPKPDYSPSAPKGSVRTAQ